MARKRYEQAKRYKFEDAYNLAHKNSDVVIISAVTEDKYRIDKTVNEEEIKFYSSTINRWRKCEFILTKEILSDWYVEIEGKVR